jgi:hypothetical protein
MSVVPVRVLAPVRGADVVVLWRIGGSCSSSNSLPSGGRVAMWRVRPVVSQFEIDRS